MRKLLLFLFLFLGLNTLYSADYCRIVPYILDKEGGYFKKEDTFKGIMYTPTWKKYFGDTRARFLKMDESDWGYIFSQEFWLKFRGYDIQDEKVAEVIADWSFNAGVTQVAKTVDKILGLSIDGQFDDATIKAINEAKPSWLWAELNKERIEFYVNLGYSNPNKYRKFVKGWNNRTISLIIYQYYAPDNSCQ